MKLILEVEFDETFKLSPEEMEDVEQSCERGIDKAGYYVTKMYWKE